MNKKFDGLFSIVFTLTLCLLVSGALAQERPDGEQAKGYIAYFADDALEGRDTSTPGFDKAAEYVIDLYQKWGVEPAGENGTYIQEFPFAFYKDQFDEPEFSIAGRKYYHREGDFSVLRFSGGGKIEKEVVFVGFGISAPNLGLDEYSTVDVTDKIALIMRGTPGDDDKWNTYASDSAKVAMAMFKGAAGVLICADFQEENRSIGYWRLRPGNYRKDFLVFGVNENVVYFLLRGKNETMRSFNRRMQQAQGKMEKELKPISIRTAKKARMKVKAEFDADRIGKNVLAKIVGSDPELRDEVVVLGAHLDHLGIRYGEVYNGADDNASGSAVVMEAARVMKANNLTPKRTIVFALWGGEERGLLGTFIVR